jgi:ABC-type phosphate transport system ATPase subunit
MAASSSAAHHARPALQALQIRQRSLVGGRRSVAVAIARSPNVRLLDNGCESLRPFAI